MYFMWINQYNKKRNKEGLWIIHWPEGDLWKMGSYKNGVRQGFWILNVSENQYVKRFYI